MLHRLRDLPDKDRKTSNSHLCYGDCQIVDGGVQPFTAL